MQEIHGTAMHYPWGTTDAIPAILGIPSDGRPYAEYWLGAHPSAPSLVDDVPLDELLDADPSLLGRARDAFGGRMPFMIKLLSARYALSLQAHPPAEQAEEGYRREVAAGIPLDDPKRSYKDPAAKPELLVALSEFDVLIGFRKVQHTIALFESLGVLEVLESVIGPLSHRAGRAALEEVFLDVLSVSGDRRELINHLLVAAVAHADDKGQVGRFARLIIELDEHFPADPGILAACLMNHLTLSAGQAVAVAPGTMHAYVHGTGVEVLANSDNVIRGGLTNKHIAEDELVGVVDFGEHDPVVQDGVEEAPGVWAYPSNFPEFAVWRLECGPGRTTPVPADGVLRIALVTAGDAVMTRGDTALFLEHGQAVLLPAAASDVTLTGDAQVFVAAPGVR